MPLLLIILSITAVQFPAIVLRYLPFSKVIGRREKKKLFLCYGICFLFQCLFLYFFMRQRYLSLSPLTYKRLLFLLSTTYVFLNIIIIKGMLFKHIFIYGMQGGYSLFIHSIAAIFVGSLSPGMPMYLQFLIQTLIYLTVITIVTIPLWKLIKDSIIFTSSVSNEYYWNIIWLIPALAIYSDSVVTMNGHWLNSFPQILSRLMTALSLVVSWKWISLDLEALENTVYLKNINKVLNLQTEGLISQAHLLKESENHIKICKHDMRHNLNIISSLIEDNKLSEAKIYINNLDSNLKTTNPIVYCDNTVINSAFLIYMTKAREKDILVETELNVHEQIDWNSNDIAILIANAFENAINASSKEPVENREIQISARSYDNNLAIVIKNRFSGEVLMNKDGFPTTTEVGHGFGIQSILSIVNKYNAYANCVNENGWFTMTFLFTSLNTN